LLNYPDYVVFDIDPYIYSGKEARARARLNTVAFEKGKEVAFWLRELLQACRRAHRQDLRQDGLHVFVRSAARSISTRRGKVTSRRAAPDAPAPKDITLEWSVPKRTGRSSGLQHERARQDPERRLFAQGAPGAPGLDAPDWEELAGHPSISG